MNPHFFTAPFCFTFIWFRVQGSGLSWRLRRNYTYDDTRSPFFSLLPLEGGAPKGRRLAACNGTPTFAEANPASLVCPFQRKGRE